MPAFLDSIGYDGWILHALLWLPLLGMAAVLLGPAARAKHTAFVWSLVLLALSLGLWWAFEPGVGEFQFFSSVPWIAAWGVSYAVALDGISLFMVILTAFTTAVAILGSFNYIKKHEKAFYALMLLMATGVIGVFVAVDLFLFYVFWEITLIPMYFIIGVWGGDRRIYSAVKFFLFTAFGSLLMLVALLYLYFAAGGDSFAYADLMNAPLSLEEQLWLFGAFCLAFSIKVPVFPFHTWLPDAHVEAPTPGSVVLAAVLLKMGTYGFLRFLLPFFPAAATHTSVITLMMTLGIIGIIYTAWVAAVQPDAKKLVAYTSVAHMGFVVLGIFALNVNGLQGGLVVMISHGVSTGALFLLLGMMYERRHTRLIADFGGIGRVTPWFATAFMITAMASIGLPGTSGFVGEFLALLGTFQARPVMAIFAASGVIFAAYYMLPMVQKVFFNALEKPENREMPDLSKRELTILAPMLALMIWIGVQPTPLLERMEPSVRVILEQVGEPGGQAEASIEDEARLTLTSATASSATASSATASSATASSATSSEGEDGSEEPIPSAPGDQE